MDLAEVGTAALYLVVFGVVFVESGLLVGLVLPPGDSILFMAGLLIARVDTPWAMPLLAVVAFAAATIGDSLGYAIGRRLGREYLVRGLSKRGAGVLRKAEDLYERHGWFAIVAARWIPWVRTIVPTLAGIGGMPYLRFLTANVVGALLWAVGLVVLGYVAHFVPWAHGASMIAMAIAIISIPIYVLVRRRRERTGLGEIRHEEAKP
ncbi:DedA family protein [Actinopolymorpha alba]|uniref:DedA family protein n=1 Tax=Actinopolymorpha alba TaxID=533267 RepID=UPI00039A7962|nr:DedA family protein [Actinopolymorpha alba]